MAVIAWKVNAPADAADKDIISRRCWQDFNKNMNNRNKPRPRKGDAGGAFKEDRETHQSLRDLENTAAAMTTMAMTTTMTTFTTEKNLLSLRPQGGRVSAVRSGWKGCGTIPHIVPALPAVLWRRGVLCTEDALACLILFCG